MSKYKNAKIKIDLKNVYKMVSDEVEARIKIDSKGKTPDEWAQFKGFENWLGYAAWSRHTGGFYETAVQMLKAVWKEQDPEEFARQKKILDDQSVREHSYIGVKTSNNHYKPQHKSNFTAEQLEEMYRERGVHGEPVEYRW